jgi:hypothetical protein
VLGLFFGANTNSTLSPLDLILRTRPGFGIIEPCLPSPAKAPPSGPGWLQSAGP